MRITLFISVAATLMIAGFVATGLGNEPGSAGASETPSLVGTYKLMLRELPDGAKETAPIIMGLLTYTKTHRNLDVVHKDANGKYFSYSLVSTYKLADGEYTETLLFSVVNDETNGEGIHYELAGQTRSVPVVVKDGKLEFKMPFDPPTVVFDQNWITAKAEGAFTDYWERVD